jgi:quercetin dioxygenase-like cupin family protein
MRRTITLTLTVVAFACTGPAIAQIVTRTPLQAVVVPAYNTIMDIVDIASGGAAGPHTHPGVETGYVLEGELNLSIAGQPDLHLKAGDSYAIPAGVVHNPKAEGVTALKLLAVFVVDPNKPFSTSVP